MVSDYHTWSTNTDTINNVSIMLSMWAFSIFIAVMLAICIPMFTPPRRQSVTWNFKMPPKSELIKRWEDYGHDRQHLTFQKSTPGYKWNIIFNKKHIRLVILQDPPSADNNISVKPSSVSIQLVSKGYVVKTGKLSKIYDNSRCAVWGVSTDTFDYHWNDEIDTVQMCSVVYQKCQCKEIPMLVSDEPRLERVEQVEDSCNNSLEIPSQIPNEYFKNPLMSDVSIEVKDESFPAHRMQLSLHSPVFRQMFMTDTKEKRQVVVVEDINPAAFELLLKYIYCGSSSIDFSELPDYVCLELFQAACKYDMEPLINICKLHLFSSVTKENCLEMYSTAKSCQVDSLVEMCWEIIQQNKKELFQNRPSFNRLITEFPDVAHDLFRSLAGNESCLDKLCEIMGTSKERGPARVRGSLEPLKDENIH